MMYQVACHVFDTVNATEVHARECTNNLAVLIAERCAAQAKFLVND